MLIGALYVGGAARCGELGLPLDDGWIHQTYARNLAYSGRLTFDAQRVSTGSTAPLWTAMLAIGYILRVVPLLWTYALGAAGWLLVALVGAALSERLFPRQRSLGTWVMFACLIEWHLAWAAFSGMETILFIFLALLLIERYAADTRPFWLGLIGGLLFLTRPEGIVLVGLVGMTFLLEKCRPFRITSLVSAAADLGAGLGALLIPYLVFNMVVSGHPFPNTFYAKQAEYRELLALPLWTRLWIVIRRPLIGAQVLLIPGFVSTAVALVLRREWATSPGRPLLPWLPLVWWASYFAIYALRMPVDYQYGRYLMPTIPVMLIYGLAGTTHWLRPRSRQIMRRVLSRAVPLTLTCLGVGFLIIGGQAYADDVCVINCEMVATGRWLNDNTPPDALIAAHDIGAIGYFAHRPLLDLAGLITPQVVPFIRDQDRLLDFVIAQGADYLVTFPSWYPQMVSDERLIPIYNTDCELTRRRGGDNMVIYGVQLTGSSHEEATRSASYK